MVKGKRSNYRIQGHRDTQGNIDGNWWYLHAEVGHGVGSDQTADRRGQAQGRPGTHQGVVTHLQCIYPKDVPKLSIGQNWKLCQNEPKG